MMYEEGDCGSCPLDPCRITAEECGEFWVMVEKFRDITRLKLSEEYMKKRGLEEIANG